MYICVCVRTFSSSQQQQQQQRMRTSMTSSSTIPDNIQQKGTWHQCSQLHAFWSKKAPLCNESLVYIIIRVSGSCQQGHILAFLENCMAHFEKEHCLEIYVGKDIRNVRKLLTFGHKHRDTVKTWLKVDWRRRRRQGAVAWILIESWN